jgi:hypothetical protein
MVTERGITAIPSLLTRVLAATWALTLALFSVAIALTVPRIAAAQSDEAPAELKSAVDLKVAQDDYVAASSVLSARYHLMRARTSAALLYPQDSPAISLPKDLRLRLKTDSLSTPPSPSFYPDEVFNLGFLRTGTPGKTIVSTKSHPIYLGVSNVPGDASCGAATGACWGNPNKFLTDYGLGNFSHVLDQYVGSTASDRYTLGSIFTATLTVFPGTSGTPTLAEDDILALVHAAAKSGGAGYGNIYHVFIPPNVDTCMDEGPCYSPDNTAVFEFCAYHFRAVFSDIGNVYYTVQPFQDVAGCQVPASDPTPPNGQLADSQDTTLSHELAEEITDPDITTGFRTIQSLPSYLMEVADVCEDPVENFIEVLNGHDYEIQLIYSDFYEACASSS